MQTREKLRGADTDRQGHVNDADFSTMFETGRVELSYASGEALWTPGVEIDAVVHNDVVEPNRLYSETYYPQARCIDDPSSRAGSSGSLAGEDQRTFFQRVEIDAGNALETGVGQP